MSLSQKESEIGWIQSRCIKGTNSGGGGGQDVLGTTWNNPTGLINSLICFCWLPDTVLGNFGAYSCLNSCLSSYKCMGAFLIPHPSLEWCHEARVWKVGGYRGKYCISSRQNIIASLVCLLPLGKHTDGECCSFPWLTWSILVPGFLHFATVQCVTMDL